MHYLSIVEMRKKPDDWALPEQQEYDNTTSCGTVLTDKTFQVSRKKSSERIIMGIDPGTNILGYGVLSVTGKNARMIAMGVIDLRKVNGVYLKLGRIYERVNSLIASFLPDELSIESPFF